MDTVWKTSVGRQFGAAIEMLENALRNCPDELWQAPLWEDASTPAEAASFWNIAYHTLFWLDLYLSGSVEGFAPPAPFGLEELEVGPLPRMYTRDELQVYLDYARKKCRATIADLTDERAAQVCRFRWGELPFAELLLYTMRHTQEHGAQLNLFLGQKKGLASRWEKYSG